MKKVLVINGKGGVGKTTAAIELFAPYLFVSNNFEKVNVFSFDEENFLNNFYESSQVLRIKAQKVNSMDMEDTISQVVLQDKPLVMDIGANKTTTFTLKALENTGLIFAFDLVAIPVTDGEQDMLNAKSIYNAIKRMDKSMKVVFVLSRYVDGRDVQLQFESFFDELYPLLNEYDKKYIQLIDSDAIKFAKKAAKSIYEISLEKFDFDGAIKEAIKSRANQEDILALSKQKMQFKTCVDYRLNVLNNGFEVLDSLDRR